MQPSSASDRGTPELRDCLVTLWLRKFARSPDVVLFDGPSVLGPPDTLAVAEEPDTTLLVLNVKETKGSIDRTIRQLSLVHAQILDQVLDRSDTSHVADGSFKDHPPVVRQASGERRVRSSRGEHALR